MVRTFVCFAESRITSKIVLPISDDDCDIYVKIHRGVKIQIDRPVCQNRTTYAGLW